MPRLSHTLLKRKLFPSMGKVPIEATQLLDLLLAPTK